jgi:Cytochrome P450
MELGDYQPSDLAELKHLNGVINEALRLLPPGSIGTFPVVTPPEGLIIDGTFIPGNTTLYCPQYVLGRSTKNLFSNFKFISLTYTLD